MKKKNLHDSPFVDGARADRQCVGPTFKQVSHTTILDVR
jgi:hypothetical protein